MACTLVWGQCSDSYFFCPSFIGGLCIGIFGLIPLSIGVHVVARYRLRFYASIISFLRLLCVACSAGILMATFVLVDRSQDIDAAIDEPCHIFVFRAISDRSDGTYGSSILAETELISGRRVRVHVKLDRGCTISCWDVWTSQGSIDPVVVDYESGIVDRSSLHMLQKGCCGCLSCAHPTLEQAEGISSVIAQMRSDLSDALNGEGVRETSLLRACALGDRTALFADKEFIEAIRSCGLSHLVAVSGMHLTLLMSCISYVLRHCRVPCRCAWVAELLFLGLYVILTGASPSVMRAALMSVCAIGALFAGRRTGALHTVSISTMCILAVDPFTALSCSLVLSVSSTVGIIVIGPLFNCWLSSALKQRYSILSESLSISSAATLATLPFVSAFFDQISLIGPLMNCLIAPLVPLLCAGGLGAAVLSCGLPVCADIGLIPIHCCASLFSSLVATCAQIPYVSIDVGHASVVSIIIPLCCVCALWLCWPQPGSIRWKRFISYAGSMALLVLFYIALSIHAEDQADRIIVLDVGQGDAIVIKSDGYAVLIDTGNRDQDVIDGLKHHRVFHLDMVIITHADNDHCGSLPALRSSIPIDTVAIASDLAHDPSDKARRLRSLLDGCRVRRLLLNDTIRFGIFSATVIGPERCIDGGGNADSLILDVGADADYNGQRDWTTLMCGDAEADSLADVLKHSHALDVDILKVGHHGSRKALSDQLIEQINPSIGLISCGRNNCYGHPHAATIDLLERHHIKYGRTDLEGDISCDLTSDRIEVFGVR
ncbi:MAG: DNA internalization-related competence protein ComEC/Rec2 [Eggerthellaceae bacterium]|nr:DNA internalization-related competence protein ComEC/Rec2 [Eggerthellaceae bacterium]